MLATEAERPVVPRGLTSGLLLVVIGSVFLVALALLSSAADRIHFDVTDLLLPRFFFASLVMGVVIRILSDRVLVPGGVILVLVLAAHGLVLATEPPKLERYLIKSKMRDGVSLMYTFGCYGEPAAPFYDDSMFNYPFLPGPESEKWFRFAWEKTFERYLWPGHEGTPEVYYEPSIERINEQLSELHATGVWSCVRNTEDSHRLERLR
jgi:hypothetical protein